MGDRWKERVQEHMDVTGGRECGNVGVRDQDSVRVVKLREVEG